MILDALRVADMQTEDLHKYSTVPRTFLFAESPRHYLHVCMQYILYSFTYIYECSWSCFHVKLSNFIASTTHMHFKPYECRAMAEYLWCDAKVDFQCLWSLSDNSDVKLRSSCKTDAMVLDLFDQLKKGYTSVSMYLFVQYRRHAQTSNNWTQCWCVFDSSHPIVRGELSEYMASATTVEYVTALLIVKTRGFFWLIESMSTSRRHRMTKATPGN